MTTQAGQSDIRMLTVGAQLWEGEEERGEQLVETERSDADVIKITVGEIGLYFSLAAAKEIGNQLLARAREGWDR